MAQIVGVSLDEYEKCENGESDFSFTFLHKCALALGVDITDLVTGDAAKLSRFTIVRHGDGMPIHRRNGFSYNHLAGNFKSKYSTPFVVTAPYFETEQNSPISLSTHNGEEFDYVLEGQLKVNIGGHETVLEAGDSMYYDSMTPHGMIATGGKECKFIALVMDPGGNVQEYSEPVKLEKKEFKKSDDTNKAKPVYADFVDLVEDEQGHLKEISFKNCEHFNFAYDVVDKVAQRTPDKLAMLHVDREHNERRFTFGDISRLSNKAANYLTSLGIKKGDKVMLVLKRHYQFWISIVALHKIGAIVIPATNLLMKKDFVYRFDLAECNAILCTSHGNVAEEADLAIAECPGVKVKVMCNGVRGDWHDFDSEFEAFPDTFERPELRGDDSMLMFFSSGTTGYPKIVVHTFTYALGHLITAKYWHNVNPNGLHFTISDTGWGKALWGKLYGQWLCEAPVFTYDFDKFAAEDILPMFAKYHITTFCAPPTMYRFFIKEDLKKYDLSSLEYANVAGEALNPEVFQQFYNATGLKLMEGFGQTETTLSVANLVGMTPKPGSMGKPSPLYDVDIVLPDGKSAAVGEVGEIVVRTNKRVPFGLFSCYYRDAERTKEAYHDNVYHTGDTAWRDEDGYYWYVGRVDDLIKSSGYRIGPFEIESVLMELPYVLECAVTGVPDEIRGQVVKATIVLTKGTVGTDELKKEIQQYVKTHTAPYKYPRIVEFVDELPKTISGKIRRVDLRK
ncbi:MAG: cupin domain-containing protein [Ruminococcaceae bacterium]|nr:cupin domain-containing protein [Oscillospiraceae bacterium]